MHITIHRYLKDLDNILKVGKWMPNKFSVKTCLFKDEKTKPNYFSKLLLPSMTNLEKAPFFTFQFN